MTSQSPKRTVLVCQGGYVFKTRVKAALAIDSFDQRHSDDEAVTCRHIDDVGDVADEVTQILLHGWLDNIAPRNPLPWTVWTQRID